MHVVITLNFKIYATHYSQTPMNVVLTIKSKRARILSLFYLQKEVIMACSTSHKPQATSHKPQVLNLRSPLLTFSALALLSLVPLSAEKDGAFVEGGFEYSNFGGGQKLSNPVLARVLGKSKPMNGNLFGADIQIGYKQFFGKKKRFGLRYYGFFSGQGGSASYAQQQFQEDEDGEDVAYWVPVKQQAANLFYGVGIDALFNFYEKKQHSFGVFAGVMVGGSSWLMGKGYADGQCAYSNDSGQCVSMNSYFKERASFFNDYGFKGNFSPTYVQVLVNLGFRANLTPHQGFELGVRIPTINDPYLTLTRTQDYEEYGIKKGDSINISFRRNIAIFLNYVYNF
ncbi:outer membrane protein [Helicobacter vulpis]|uniref:outer membrane protein n=1 Tax=Helicobacter vulpis TaxID=2316076 RepID=UPI002E256B6F